MSRQYIAAHYTRLLARWPRDILRPEKPFQSLLEARKQTAPSPARDEEKEINAAYLLLENHFSKRFPPQQKLLRPASNPEHYETLAKELKELPNRSVLGGWIKRLKGLVRMK